MGSLKEVRDLRRGARNSQRDWFDWIGLILNVILALAAIVSLCIAGRSVRYTGEQAAELRRQTELQNRPFLILKPGRFSALLDRPGESEAEVWFDLYCEFQNTGPVPAYNVHIEEFDIEVNRGVIHQKDIPDKTEILAVYPGNPVTEKTRFTLDKQIARDYHTGAQHFKVSARVSYRGVEPLKENPYWYEVVAESNDFGSGFNLIRTNGN